MVKEYKSQLIRVQRWYGVERPKTPFNFEEMGDYMDKRRRKLLLQIEVFLSNMS